LIIVVVGLASVIFAATSTRNGVASRRTSRPVGTTWHAGFDYYVCGTQDPHAPQNGEAGIITRQ